MKSPNSMMLLTVYGVMHTCNGALTCLGVCPNKQHILCRAPRYYDLVTSSHESSEEHKSHITPCHIIIEEFNPPPHTHTYINIHHSNLLQHNFKQIYKMSRKLMKFFPLTEKICKMRQFEDINERIVRNTVTGTLKCTC